MDHENTSRGVHHDNPNPNSIPTTGCTSNGSIQENKRTRYDFETQTTRSYWYQIGIKQRRKFPSLCRKIMVIVLLIP